MTGSQIAGAALIGLSLGELWLFFWLGYVLFDAASFVWWIPPYMITGLAVMMGTVMLGGWLLFEKGNDGED